MKIENKPDKWGRIPMNCSFHESSFLTIKRYCRDKKISFRQVIRELVDERAALINRINETDNN